MEISMYTDNIFLIYMYCLHGNCNVYEKYFFNILYTLIES
ncbi:hypothetical protein BMW23_0705 [Bodo saltans virus]|uniref:Uncharacterized protein n=1 Tax=Bodo saltans virus TaxID=2024608 RepID=A0A2H4UV04_9VIRU|nr:hypothetical protein QJ851_gp0688 [Bodo saltans virus]ATZ80751.1 hypothetical protein BMW23_0705 [Bodo saltans virus]